MQKCRHDDNKVVVPVRNPGLFMIVYGKKGSCVWACTGPQQFLYYPVAVEKSLAST